MILSDLGADVIKVERIDGGDDARGMGPHRGQWGSFFVPLNRGKRSIAVDVTTHAGRMIVYRLAAKSDVYVENFRGGKAAELGLDEPAIRRHSPEIIYACLSAFGPTGPDYRKPGYDALVQGRTGIMSVTGADANASMRAGVSIIDMGAGAWLAMGVLAALLEKQRTGKGQRVDSSLLQTGVMLMAYHLSYREFSGKNPVPQGSGHASFAPYGAFHAADGDIMIGVSNDRVFRRLCKAVGRPEWIEDPRFATNVLRVQNRPVLNEELQAIFVQQSRAHWVAVFDEWDVALGPIQTAEQVMHDPQIEALGQLQRIPLPGCEETAPVPRLPFSLSETPPEIAGPPPVLGAQGREILREVDFSDSEIDEFIAARVCAIP